MEEEGVRPSFLQMISNATEAQPPDPVNVRAKCQDSDCQGLKMAQNELEDALYKLTRVKDYFLRSDGTEGALEEARQRITFLDAEVKELRKQKLTAERELKKITGREPYDFNTRSSCELRELMELFESGVNNIRLLLEKRNKGLEERSLCTVCFERERIVLLQPCAHLALCGMCAERVHLCPICRGEINARVQVKVS